MKTWRVPDERKRIKHWEVKSAAWRARIAVTVDLPDCREMPKPVKRSTVSVVSSPEQKAFTCNPSRTGVYTLPDEQSGRDVHGHTSYCIQRFDYSYRLTSIPHKVIRKIKS
jgi:hypothetical protein